MSTLTIPFGNLILPLWTYTPARNGTVVVKTRADVEWQLTRRALRDPLFMADLVADPAMVLRQEHGATLPEGTQLHVLRETATQIYLVLPHNPFAGLAEARLHADTGLSLEQLAGLICENRRDTLVDPVRNVELVTRAWRDEAFCAEFLASPASVLEREFGLSFPEGYSFKAVAESPTNIFIVLPHIEAREDPAPFVSADWEQANLGASHVMMVAQSDRCAATCLILFGGLYHNTDTECWVTCVDREEDTYIYRE